MIISPETVLILIWDTPVCSWSKILILTFTNSGVLVLILQLVTIWSKSMQIALLNSSSFLRTSTGNNVPMVIDPSRTYFTSKGAARLIISTAFSKYCFITSFFSPMLPGVLIFNSTIHLSKTKTYLIKIFTFLNAYIIMIWAYIL